MDRLENCYLYGEYACSQLPDWAAENCALTCKVCQPGIETLSMCPSLYLPSYLISVFNIYIRLIDCGDKRDDCSSYGKQVCEGVYKPWAEQNCAKFCSLGDCKYLMPQKSGNTCYDYTLL